MGNSGIYIIGFAVLVYKNIGETVCFASVSPVFQLFFSLSLLHFYDILQGSYLRTF